MVIKMAARRLLRLRLRLRLPDAPEMGVVLASGVWPGMEGGLKRSALWSGWKGVGVGEMRWVE